MATKKASAKPSSKVRSASKKVSSVKGDIVSGIPIGALLAELIGTFLLAAIIIATSGQPIFILFGLAAIVLIIGQLSGAHVNPAITFGAWVTHQIRTARALGYIVAQGLGAMLAIVILTQLAEGQPGQVNPLTGESVRAELFQAQALTEGKEWYAFFAELVGAAIFGFGVANALREKKERFAAAFTVGGALFLGLIIAGSAAILNPAVAISLKALSWETWPLAVYFVSPLIGAAIGFVLYQVLRDDVKNLKLLKRNR